MIRNKKDYEEYFAADNAAFLKKSFSERLISGFAKYPEYEIFVFKKYLRKAEYAFNTANGNRLKWLKALYYERRKNVYGDRLGIEIAVNSFGKGLQIYHGAGIVVNPKARIGENCKLHGGNCIGNNGKNEEVPIIGDNLDLGYGASIIGGVRLANHVTVGSQAVVVKSCDKDNAVLVGVPAEEIGR